MFLMRLEGDYALDINDFTLDSTYFNFMHPHQKPSRPLSRPYSITFCYILSCLETPNTLLVAVYNHLSLSVTHSNAKYRIGPKLAQLNACSKRYQNFNKQITKRKKIRECGFSNKFSTHHHILITAGFTIPRISATELVFAAGRTIITCPSVQYVDAVVVIAAAVMSAEVGTSSLVSSGASTVSFWASSGMYSVGVEVGLSVGSKLSSSCVPSTGGVGNVNPVNFDVVVV